MKVKILVNFNGNVNHASVRFNAGEIVDIPDADADDFVRAGYVEQLLNKPPEVKIVHKGSTGKKAVK